MQCKCTRELKERLLHFRAVGKSSKENEAGAFTCKTQNCSHFTFPFSTIIKVLNGNASIERETFFSYFIVSLLRNDLCQTKLKKLQGCN